MSTNSDIGNRLREERELLCLSQALFAGKVGISRMSQVNYESGKRSPDASYLLAAYEAGVDVGYVITGKRSEAPDFYRMATVLVLESIQLRTGFAEDILSFVIELLAEAAADSWLADRAEMLTRPDVQWDMTQWIGLAELRALTAALFENARLLRDVFGAVNSSLVFDGPKRLSGQRRLSLVLMLFRAFRTTGNVDQDVVDEAVTLASGSE